MVDNPEPSLYHEPELKIVNAVAKSKLFMKKALSPLARKVLGQPEPTDLDVTEVAGFSVVYRKGSPDEYILQKQLAVDRFLPTLPGYTPRPGHVIVDLGAHIGSFTMIAGKMGATVHAIEARRETYNLLRINSKMNQLNNVHAHHLALSDHDGECQLYYSWMGNWGDSIVGVTTVGSETVPCRTLTRFMDEQGIQHCDLLKSNCEGGEFQVLLSTSRDVLGRIDRMIVAYHCDKEQMREDKLVRHFEASGFKTRITNRDNKDRGWIIASRS